MFNTFVKDTEYIPLRPIIYEGPCSKCIYYNQSVVNKEGWIKCDKYNMYTTHDRSCKSFRAKNK